ncbi:(2Fe-2S)-binding protein [Aquabacterium sp.]|uniref:(2Fe-2S)-binding protein n=1 Tax=Aquabacterium sp. TaxID=1872578 RepID=UPI003D6CC50E
MIVCVCNRISDRDIVRHAQQGCSTFEDLQFELGVSTCCGSCEQCARDVFQGAQRPHTEATIHIVAPMRLPAFA